MLTIIVPIYNSEKYLSECIKSILKQDYKDIELILIDDGSTDNSGLICDSFSVKDKRVKTVHIINQGVGNARNVGLSISRGEYITFVDSDDYVSCDIYSDNIRMLDNDASIDFLQLPIYSKRTDSCIISTEKNLFDAWIFQNKKITNYFWDKIFRRRLFDSLRFPVDMRYEDRYLFYDVLRITKKIYCSDSGYYYYRQHSQQITRQTNFHMKKDLINANFHTLENIPDDCCNSLVRCFWDTIVLIESIPKEQIDKDWIRKIYNIFPVLYVIWRSSNPIGIKMNLSFRKMFSKMS